MKLRIDSDQGYKEPSVVPLVNIVFLLLIFFMLLGRITSPEVLDVRPPASTSGAQIDTRRDILILVSNDGRLALNDDEIEQDLLLSAVAKLLDEEPAIRVRIKADAGLDAVTLIRLMEHLKEAGVKRLLLLTERPEPS
jgi:biopolymer transport protein ExbD